jgi:hypothetical protein
MVMLILFVHLLLLRMLILCLCALLCVQAFYNTKIIDVINKLIGGVDIAASSTKSPSIKKDKERESFQESKDGSPPASLNASPQILSRNGLLVGKDATRSNNAINYSSIVSSSLYQISIPDGLESRTYGALYRLLSRRNQIPLGILRGVFSNTKSGPKANKMPYVFTNPPKDTELFTCDKIFVLSQTPVGISRNMRVRILYYLSNNIF